MAVNLPLPRAEDLKPVAGFELGWAEAGIRKANRKDVLVARVAEGSTVAGVFTRNRFCAAPVQVCREHLAAGKGIRAIVVNTGNANAGTGRPAWPMPAPPAKRWPRHWASRRNRCCPSRPG